MIIVTTFEIKIFYGRVPFNKQGSVENDGRSNIDDRSEFKIVSDCCYLNCCHADCGNFEKLGNFQLTQT